MTKKKNFLKKTFFKKKKTFFKKKKMLDFDILLAPFKTAWTKWANKSFDNEWEDLGKFLLTFQKNRELISIIKKQIGDHEKYFFKVVLPFIIEEVLSLQGQADQVQNTENTILLPRHMASKLIACVFLGVLTVEEPPCEFLYDHLEQCMCATPRGNIAIRMTQLTSEKEIDDAFFQSLSATPLIYEKSSENFVLEISEFNQLEAIKSQPEWTAIEILLSDSVFSDPEKVLVVSGLLGDYPSNQRFSNGSLCQVMCVLPPNFTTKAMLCALATPMYDVYGQECKDVSVYTIESDISNETLWMLASIAGKNLIVNNDDEYVKFMAEHKSLTVAQFCEKF